MPEGKNHDIERSHSKRWSKTSICEIGNYFWDNPVKLTIHFYRPHLIQNFKNSKLKNIKKRTNLEQKNVFFMFYVLFMIVGNNDKRGRKIEKEGRGFGRLPHFFYPPIFLVSHNLLF